MRYRHMLAMLLVALLLMSACGLGAGTPDADLAAEITPDAAAGPTAPPAATTALPAATAASEELVTIGFGAQEFERQIYEPLIKTFNEQNPNIQVQFVALDEFTRPSEGQEFDPGRMMRQVVGAADTSSAFFVRPEEISSGLLRDLTPLIESDPDFNRDDYFPITLAAGSQEGGLYMLPHTMFIQLLSYNKALWAARGLPDPKPDWTWDDLLAAAEQLAQKRGDEVEVYGLLDWGGGFTLLLGELSKAGVSVFSTPSDQLRLDAPEVVAALERVAALAKSGAVYVRADSPGLGGISPDQFRTLITEQKAGMWQRDMLFGGPPSEKPAFEIGTAAYPQLPVPFFGGTQGYIMSSGTQHPEEAWRWLSFLSKQEIKQPFEGPDAVSQLPARKSIAESSGFWSKLDEEGAAAVRATVERPTVAQTDVIFDNNLFTLLDQAVSAVVGGEQSAEQALREAQTALDQRIAQAQSTPSPTPNSAPVVVATPVAEVVPEGATKIVFGAPGFEAEEIRRAARQFNQQNLGIFVEIKNIDPAGGSFSFSELAGPSDCFTWFGPPGQEEITSTLDLQPLFDADATLKIDDYPPALLARFQSGSGLHGLPYVVRLRVLTYNQTAFDDAGLAYPNAGWTMDDFVDAAQKLTSGDGKDKRYGYASMGSDVQDLIFFLDRMEASPTKGSGDAVEPNFSDPKLLQAVRTYVDLLKNFSPHKQLNGYTNNASFGGDVFDLLNNGRVGMWFDFGDVFFFGPGAPDAPTFTKAIAPPPLGGSPLSPDELDTRGLFISTKTQYAQGMLGMDEALEHQRIGPPGRLPSPHLGGRVRGVCQAGAGRRRRGLQSLSRGARSPGHRGARAVLPLAARLLLVLPRRRPGGPRRGPGA